MMSERRRFSASERISRQRASPSPTIPWALISASRITPSARRWADSLASVCIFSAMTRASRRDFSITRNSFNWDSRAATLSASWFRSAREHFHVFGDQVQERVNFFRLVATKTLGKLLLADIERGQSHTATPLFPVKVNPSPSRHPAAPGPRPCK